MNTSYIEKLSSNLYETFYMEEGNGTFSSTLIHNYIRRGNDRIASVYNFISTLKEYCLSSK
jgi:hypothetical protein